MTEVNKLIQTVLIPTSQNKQNYRSKLENISDKIKTDQFWSPKFGVLKTSVCVTASNFKKTEVSMWCTCSFSQLNR